MEVTAVIPTYRRPELLDRAVHSVLSQSWPHLRVLVLDNASGDRTEEVMTGICRREPRVTYVRQPRNLGATANFQSGLDRVETPYFSFLSDDDVLLPGFYAHALETLQRHPGAGFFCGQVILHDPVDGQHSLSPRRGWEEGLHAAGKAVLPMVRQLFTWTSCLLTTATGRRAGPMEAIGTPDLLFMSRAAAAASFVVSLRPCAIFVSSAEGVFHAMPLEEMSASFAAVSQDLRRLPGIPREDAKAIARLLEEKPFKIAAGRMKQAFLGGDWDTFDRMAAFLGDRVDRGQALRLALGRRRHQQPRLVAAARRVLAWRKRKGTRHRPLSVPELLELYGRAD